VGKGVLLDLFNEPWPGALATLKARPMIGSVNGSRDRASPFIQLHPAHPP
jgi:hypothetical protein